MRRLLLGLTSLLFLFLAQETLALEGIIGPPRFKLNSGYQNLQAENCIELGTKYDTWLVHDSFAEIPSLGALEIPQFGSQFTQNTGGTQIMDFLVPQAHRARDLNRLILVATLGAQIQSIEVLTASGKSYSIPVVFRQHESVFNFLRTMPNVSLTADRYAVQLHHVGAGHRVDRIRVRYNSSSSGKIDIYGQSMGVSVRNLTPEIVSIQNQPPIEGAYRITVKYKGLDLSKRTLAFVLQAAHFPNVFVRGYSFRVKPVNYSIGTPFNFDFDVPDLNYQLTDRVPSLAVSAITRFNSSFMAGSLQAHQTQELFFEFISYFGNWNPNFEQLVPKVQQMYID